MPYVSDDQRRFFHSDGARKAGITPAMVQEYDEASRGKKLPDAVEKQATFVVYMLGKMAAVGMSKMLKAPAKPLGGSVGAKAQGGQGQGPNPIPAPGDYRNSFLEGSSDMAQRASGDKLNAGESLTMPT